MFCVYGVTAESSAKKAMKKWESLSNAKKQNMSQSEYEEFIRVEQQAFFERSRPSRISADLSTPQRCEEYIQLTRDTTECRALEIRVHIIKTDKKGGTVLNSRTKKPTLTWAVYKPEINSKQQTKT